MKKILLCSIFILLITGCGKSKLNNLSLDELNNKLKNNETFIVYFDGDDSLLEEKLEKVLDNNNLDGYIINTSKISQEDKIKLQPDIYYDESAIVFVVNGKDPSILTHITDSSITLKEIEARLNDLGFIKK